MYAPGFPTSIPSLWQMISGWAPPSRNIRGRAETMGGDAGFDSFDRLPDLRVPTLVMHAPRIRRSPRERGLLAERIPGAELVFLEGAGHLYHSGSR